MILIVAAFHFETVPTWAWVTLGWSFHILIFLLVFLHCMKHRREATSAILWIFIAWSFPIVGALLYLYFGIDHVPYKGFLKHTRNLEFLGQREALEDADIPLAYWRTVREASEGKTTTPFAQELNRGIDAILPNHPLLTGNSITPLVAGDEAYPRMLDAIRNAKHHVHLQSFIFGHDNTTREFLDLLKEKAESGVKVRVLFDRFGSTSAFLSGMFRSYAHIPNMQVWGWTQANLLKRQFQINLRNHRKILVIDGQRAFCGGVNIADENISRPGHPALRDYHFDIQGPAVQELQYTFMLDWYFMTSEPAATLLTDKYYPHVEACGNDMIRIVNGGPSSELENISDVLFMAITEARKQILMVTPYFVPTADIIHAMRTAALRGVDVRLITPRKNNHFYSGLAARALYDELLTAGVRILERDPPFMHAKALLVDDTFALVGSANVDVRSLKLNYETNIAVFGEAPINAIKEIIIEDQQACTEMHLNQWRQRPRYRKILENFASLMTPVL